jgi:hypothetical protein
VASILTAKAWFEGGTGRCLGDWCAPPDLDLPGANSGIEAGERRGRRPDRRCPAAEQIARAVPWADDLIADDHALGDRSTLMGTQIAERADHSAVTHENDPDPACVYRTGLVPELISRENSDELSRLQLSVGVIDAYPMPEGEGSS